MMQQHILPSREIKTRPNIPIFNDAVKNIAAEHKDGKLILIAKGARNPKSKWRGHLEPFTHLNLHYYSKKDRPYQLLSSAEIINSFYKLKSRPESLLYAAVIVEILDKTQLHHSDPLIFKLILHVQKHLDEGIVDAQYLHWYFILIFLKLNGLTLNINECSQCTQPLLEAYFSPFDSNFYCSKCHAGADDNWHFSKDSLQFLRHAIKSKIPGLLGISMDNQLKYQFDSLFWRALAVHFDALQTINSTKILNILD